MLPRLSDGAYDMVFCDADPRDYPDYLSAALRLLRTGGIVAFNNAPLAAAADPEFGRRRSAMMCSPVLCSTCWPGDFEETTGRAADTRRRTARPVLLPLGDGLLAAVKTGD